MLNFFDGKRKSVFGLVSEVCMRERDVTTPPGGVFIVRTGKKKDATRPEAKRRMESAP